MMNIQKYSGWQLQFLEIDNNINEYVFHNKERKKGLVSTCSLSLTKKLQNQKLAKNSTCPFN